MKKLTRRERMLRVFRREPIDRMPIRLWGIDPMFPSDRPSYKPLYELVEQHELDLMRSWSPSKEEQDPPVVESFFERRESEKPDMWENIRVVKTPAGDLTSSHYVPKDGRPGYVKKHAIETLEDAKKWLSIPEREPKFKTDSYWEFRKKSGENALLMIGLSHPMYSVQSQMGSELFGFWLIEHRDLLHEMISKSLRSIMATVKRYIAHHVGDCFGWVGPELCIPPLASPRDFKEFVVDYDKQIIDIIHEAGKLVWVHCHGDMDPVLEGFVEMGVDCLNPMEPPPVGNLTLAEAKERVAGRMTLEGGVENGDFQLLEPEEMERVVEETVAQGKPGGGYILSSTSSPTTWAELDEKIIENHRVFVETGMRLAPYD